VVAVTTEHGALERRKRFRCPQDGLERDACGTVVRHELLGAAQRVAHRGEAALAPTALASVARAVSGVDPSSPEFVKAYADQLAALVDRLTGS
jgi:hypothetical protein